MDVLSSAVQLKRQRARKGFHCALLILGLTPMGACGPAEEEVPDAPEHDIANAVGETMASVDEILSTQVTDLLRSQARACYETGNPFGTCVALASAGSSRTRNYEGCSVYQGAFSGSVSLVFSSTDCSLDSTGKSASWIPQLTIDGRNGDRSLTVSVDGGESGMVLTRGTSDGLYNLRVDGVRRQATRAGSVVLNHRFDSTTSLTVSGLSRSSRTMSSGVLTVTDALNGDFYELRPVGLTWAANCTCAVSGDWTGTRTTSTSEESSILIELTGCGSALVTEISGFSFSESEVQLDRCISF